MNKFFNSIFFFRGVLVFSFFFVLIMATSCKKHRPDQEPPGSVALPRQILYVVKGTNFRLNYIDSNSVFQSDKVFQDSFRYEFIKGSGASIGMSIYQQSSSDIIYSWSIFVDGKLTANAFSPGGAYFTVPFK